MSAEILTFLTTKPSFRNDTTQRWMKQITTHFPEVCTKKKEQISKKKRKKEGKFYITLELFVYTLLLIQSDMQSLCNRNFCANTFFI